MTPQVLALCLVWLTSKVSHRHLSALFGVVQSIISKWLERGRRALDMALSRIPEAAVRWPTREEMRGNRLNCRHNYIYACTCTHTMAHTRAHAHADLASGMQVRAPQIRNAWGLLDGTTIPIFQPADPMVQNAYYAGMCPHLLL